LFVSTKINTVREKRRCTVPVRIGFFFVAYLYDSNVQKGAVHSYGQRGEQHDDRANQELEEHGERGDGVPAWHEPRLPRYERP